MFIDPIHSGSVALSKQLNSPDVPRLRRFAPMERLAQWWRGLAEVDGRGPDTSDLMLWASGGGRPCGGVLTGFLVMNQLRRAAIRRGQRRGSPATNRPE